MQIQNQQDELVVAVSQIIKSLEIERYLTSPAQTAIKVADMYREVFSGISANVPKIMEAIIPISSDHTKTHQLIALSSVHFFSMCEHHFLPFYGFVDLAYVPRDCVIGLGRLTRLVEALAQRPQLQERFTTEISAQIGHALNPSGVAIHVVARHLCEAMRGTREDNQVLHTYSFQGVLETDATYRAAFLESTSKSTL